MFQGQKYQTYPLTCPNSDSFTTLHVCFCNPGIKIHLTMMTNNKGHLQSKTHEQRYMTRKKQSMRTGHAKHP